VAVVVQGAALTDAAWTDDEWVNSTVGTIDCGAAEGMFQTRGEGRVLSGSLLGFDLDALAEAHGMLVTNDGSEVTHTPVGAVPASEPDAYSDPLSVTALSAVNVNLGQGVLQLPLDNETGVLSQYAQARDNGASAGAAGYVTDGGAV